MKNSLSIVQFLGYACGIASGNPASCMGPIVIEKSPFISNLQFEHTWLDQLLPDEKTQGLSALSAIARLNKTLAQYTTQLVKAQEFFTVIGGDHSSAIGTWSGVADALAGDPFGLVWVDAHADAHTPETSHSQNIHGMPLACLLGKGDETLTHLLSGKSPKLLPENLVLIGIRDYEEEELVLLNSLNVKIYFMDEVAQRGIDTVMREALDKVTQNTVGFGLSIDLDGIDPEDAPATGVKASQGINGKALCEALTIVNGYNNFLGMEVVEFLPDLDEEHKTEQLVIQLLNSAIAGRLS